MDSFDLKEQFASFLIYFEGIHNQFHPLAILYLKATLFGWSRSTVFNLPTIKASRSQRLCLMTN